MKLFKKILFLLILLQSVFRLSLKSQCVTVYPYHEDFEASAGGWVSGGVNNDWAWGTPGKAVISTAGQGIKSWIVGSLTGSSYSNGERSWVQSPCFDFTALQHPYIEFKLFWESEYKYDGSNLQYSTNGGTTWTNVGGVNTITDCYNANWYNYATINSLTTLATVKNGWAGNIQATSGACQGGNGSAGWITAKHCLSNLAGLPNVILRFTFGAGTTCNGYDGIAFDDIYIENAPRNLADFSFNCTTTSHFTFSDISTNCPSSWVWNFGDAASGANNSSALQTPSHTFSSPGLYTVQLIATNTCSGSDTVSKVISVLGISLDSLNVTCPNGNNGRANAIVTGATSAINYQWNTIPIQATDTAFNLVAGNYVVTVSSAATCPVSATVHITQPTNFSHSYTTTAAACSGNNGSASVTENGGTPAYTYVWQPAVSVSNIATNINSGSYVVSITDQNSCMDTVHVNVPSSGNTMSLAIINQNNVSCFGGNNGAATVQVSGGNAAFQYSWSPSGGTSATATNLISGIYSVTVTDANNCVSQVQDTITQPTALSHSHTTTSAVCTGANGSATITETGGSPVYVYVWQPSVSVSNSATNITGGNYVVNITDQKGCVDTVHIAVATLNNTMSLVIINQKNVSCFGGNDGTATVQVTGGTATYQYLWSPSGGTAATGNNFMMGNYTVTVTDANSCISQIQTNITQPVQLQQNHIFQNATCGNANGTATVQVTGGILPYTYIWTPAVSVSNMAVNLSTGSYSVLVRDSNLCSITDNITISSLSGVQIATITTPDTCHQSLGTATVQIITGNAPYTYQWQPSGFTTTSINNLIGDTSYTIEVTDANNCKDTATAFISSTGDFKISLGRDTTVCAGQSTLNLFPSSFPSYLWQDGSTANVFEVKKAGNYFVTVQNSYGCTASDTVIVTEHCIDELFVPNAFSPNSDGIDDYFGAITNSPQSLAYYKISIYNRWGERVFVSVDYNNRWDGKEKNNEQLIGVFIYDIEYSFTNRTDIKIIKGDVVLLN